MSANKKDSTVKPAKNMYQTKEKVLAELHAENVVSKFNTPSPECAKVEDSKAMRMIIVEQLSDFDKTPETAAHTIDYERNTRAWNSVPRDQTDHQPQNLQDHTEKLLLRKTGTVQ